MKEFLSEKNVKFAYVDVTSGISQLRQYLKVRDTAESHAMVRERHVVGIPTLVVDENSYLVNGPEHAAQLVEELHLIEAAE